MVQFGVSGTRLSLRVPVDNFLSICGHQEPKRGHQEPRFGVSGTDASE